MICCYGVENEVGEHAEWSIEWTKQKETCSRHATLNFVVAFFDKILCYFTLAAAPLCFESTLVNTLILWLGRQDEQLYKNK